MSILTLAIFHEPSGWSLDTTILERIRDGVGSDVEVRLVGKRNQLLEAVAVTDYMAGLPLTFSQMRDLEKPNLKWVQLTSRTTETAGAVRWLTGMGLRVTTSERIRAQQTAEHAMLLTLALLRKLPECVRAKDQHHWAGSIGNEVRDLASLTVAIIGVGAIASKIAPLFAAAGCDLLFVGDAARAEPGLPGEPLPIERLDEAISQADVVIVASSLPERANAVIRRPELQTLKTSAILIDVSRSGLVSEIDLVRALQREEISGAGLDVFEHAPPPPESPLWTMPNVILTPTLSAASPRHWDNAAALIIENTRRIEEGRPLVDEVFGQTAPSV